MANVRPGLKIGDTSHLQHSSSLAWLAEYDANADQCMTSNERFPLYWKHFTTYFARHQNTVYYIHRGIFEVKEAIASSY